MLEDLRVALGTFFSEVWSIFTNVEVPGTNLNFAQLWVGVLFAAIIIGFIKQIVGLGHEEKK